jgi:hypothetical protein
MRRSHLDRSSSKVVERDALEQYFWLQRGAGTLRVSRMRQQLVRALIVDIAADVDETTREISLTIHCQCG